MAAPPPAGSLRHRIIARRAVCPAQAGRPAEIPELTGRLPATPGLGSAGRLGLVCPCPRLRVPTCRRPGVRSRSIPRNASRLPSAPTSGSIRASGRIRCTRMHFFLPEARILPVNDALVTSGHDVPPETARSDHSFTAASITSRRPGWAWAQLARSPLPERVCHEVPCTASGEQVYAGRSVDAARIARTNGRCAVWPVCGSYLAPLGGKRSRDGLRVLLADGSRREPG
jgi:hypothetical protein